jgi:hypothetical protein
MWIFRDRVQSGLLKGASGIEEKANVSRKLKTIERYVDPKAEYLENTKICKVLRQIMRLKTLQQDRFKLRERSKRLLKKFKKVLRQHSSSI